VRSSPERIGGGHPPDQVAKLHSHGWSTGFPGTAQTPPVVPESLPPPCDHRLGLDEDECVPPAGPDSGEPGPEDPVSWQDAWSPGSSFVDGELMPQGEDLHLQGKTGASLVSKGCCERNKEVEHPDMVHS